MALERISLYNFRSYQERVFEFNHGVTVITGRNGAGKTNILEAVYVLLAGKSFRDSDELLVTHGQNWWRLVGDYSAEQREVRYRATGAQKKQVIVHGHDPKRFTYQHQLPVVLFEPDHMAMLHGAPRLRRDYLDTLLGKTIPHYRTTLARYERALLQRNNLLRHGRSVSELRDAVFVWDIALAEYGTELSRMRRDLVNRVNAVLPGVYSTIAQTITGASMCYEPNTDGSSQQLATALTRSLEHDMRRGTTSVGPHRDDFSLLLAGHDAKTTASRGEVRSLVLALKYIELEELSTVSMTPPLFLLDDVFSELDESRQEQVASGKYQTIITAAHIGRVKPDSHIHLS